MILDEYSALTNLCKAYYNVETYKHVKRVASYLDNLTIVNQIFDKDLKKFAYYLALAHDLWEDTDCPKDIFDSDFTKALNLLTKPKDMSYTDYCKRLSLRNNPYPDKYEIAAYFVKLADMKDHLSQKETLTEKLKTKYLMGLAELL